MATPTGQHHVIKEAGESLGQLLQAVFKESGYKRVHLVVAAPKQEAIEGKLPAVCVYLYNISLDDEGLGTNRTGQYLETVVGPGYFDEINARVQAVTVEQVAQAAAARLGAETRTVGWFQSAGRRAKRKPNQASDSEAKSVSMWPASARSASEPETMPPTISAPMSIPVSSAANPMCCSLVSWRCECACPGACEWE